MKKDKKQKEFIDIMNPMAVVEQMEVEMAMWKANTPKHRYDTMKELARKMAAMDNSDPFTYNRIFSQLQQNIYVPEDIRVKLKGFKEKR